MEYYLMNGRCFNTKSKVPTDPSLFKEWKTKLRRLDIRDNDLTDLERDLWIKKNYVRTAEPFNITEYIMNNGNIPCEV
jgi:hypothetical protein